MHSRSGILLLVSGPSGSGKTTLCEKISSEGLAYYATSATTRKPRPGEADGEDYFFHSVEDFKQLIEQGEFLEYAEVHGNFYGTLKSEVISHLENGRDVVMDIDVQGAANVRNCDDESITQSLVELFVMPESEEELLSRLTGRGTDSAEVIETRMKNALEEISHWKKYHFLLLSTDRETDYSKFKALLLSQQLKISRIKELA